jgi:hypothetical protein
MIGLAQKKVPDVRFITGSLNHTLLPVDRVDWVVASGIFYLRRYKPYAFMRKTLISMFRVARLGIAFNTLVDWEATRNDSEFRARPEKVVRLCRKLSPFFAMRADYHPGDITFYLYREQRAE